MPANERLGYRPQLDGVRALAVSAVVLYHLYLPVGAGGWIGVDIFFVLSGFLITSLLIEEWGATGKISLRQFYARRALRLLPALAVLLAAVAVLSAVIHKEVSTEAIVTVALYIGNWPAALHGLDMGPLGQCWSLGVEEQFYIVFPILFALLLRRVSDWRKIATFIAAGIIGSWALCLVLSNDNYMRLYFGTDTRAASLLMGCLGAIAFKSGWLDKISGRALRVGALAAVAGLIGFTLAPLNISQYHWLALYFGVIDLGALVLVLGVLGQPAGAVGRVLARRPLVAIGRLSYGIYLWSFPIDHIVQARIHNRIPLTVVELVLTATMAIASYRIVERPFLRLKKRFNVPVPTAT